MRRSEVNVARNSILVRINGNAENLKRTLDGVKKETRTLEASLKSVATKGAIAFAGLGVGIGSAVAQAAKFEQINTQFEVLIGNAEDSKKALDQLKDFSAGTPFEFESIAKAGQQLLGFGFAAEELRPQLESIGNVAAAVGKPIDEIGLIFGQVAAAGKLTGERLLQFQERAIPIGPAIAKTLGVAESSVKDLVSKGAVSFATFEKAFASLSQEGGVAFGALEKQSNTVSGQFSTLGDNVKLLVADFGVQFFPVVKAVTQALLSFIKVIRENQELVKYGAAVIAVATAVTGLVTVLATVGIGLVKFKIALAAAAAASPAFAAGLTGIQAAATGAGTAIKFLFANPLGIAITALTAAAVAVFTFRKEIQAGFGAALDVVRDFATRAGENLEGFKNILIGIATADFTKAKEGFSQLFDLSGEGERAAATFSDSYAKRMEQFKAEEEERQNEIRELKVKKAQEENELLLEKDRELKEGLAAQRLEFDEAQIEQDIEKAEKLQEVQDKATKEADKKKKKAAQDQANLEQASANASVNLAKSTANLISSVSREESRLAFAISRGAAIAQSIIATRLASAQALASPPGPPATFPLAAQVRAAGALNTAAIVAQTFTAQKGFSGGGSPFGESLVSTFTPREIVVPERFSEGIKRGEFSLESSKKKEGEGSGGAMQVVIGFTDDAFEIIEEKLIERQVLSQRLGAI
jgi:tape measure domain-containing protein